MTQTEREALVALYDATDGPNWGNNKNWNTDADLSEWYGVRVNSQGCVTELALSHNKLLGHIPAQLGDLGALKYLYLKNNELDGPIPRELGNLAALQSLTLYGNKLSGHIPQQLGRLSALKSLDLGSNTLDGSIPKELGALRALRDLWLYSNQLSGPIPPELGNLAALQRLGLGNNELSGPIPPELGRLAALKELYLFNNQLSGPIPRELGNLAALQSLDLSFNTLSGHIPPGLGDLSELQQLSLGINALTGAIPAQLGALNKLTRLDLSINQLSGPIPKELGALSKLEQLVLSSNGLTGHIPLQLGQLGALQYLSLADNELDGSIPPELGKLAALQRLNLKGNQLTGTIPAQLGDLSSLGDLDLRDNLIPGPIPEQLRKHPNFSRFSIGIAMDGPPLPRVDGGLHAIKILIVPVLLGYFDLGSDLYTAVSYYKTGHPIWFGLGLFFALGPALVVSVFFLSGSEWYRRVLVATQLSLLWEALMTADKQEYSGLLALVRVIEPLFESVPQLLLQLYALLVLWIETSSSQSRLVWRLVSVCISATSLAYAATDVCSVEMLLKTGGGGGIARFRACPSCPSLTGIVFSRVPIEGASTLKGLGTVHPRSHVWLCFMYHVLEICSRFISLVMLALVMREWFFLVLPYLWGSRCLIVWTAALQSEDHVGYDAARRALGDFRFRVRLVAMPFLDSILDGTLAFASGLILTLVEFIACLVMYHLYRDDDLTPRVRVVLAVVAISCMVGKMCLALVAIFPLKGRDGSEWQGDAVGEGGNGAPSSGVGKGCVVTDEEAVAGLEMAEMREATVECGVVPSEGTQVQPATHAVSTLASSSVSEDAKVEDEGGGGAPSSGVGTGCVVTDEAVAESEMAGTREATVGCGVAPSEGTQLQPATHAVSTLATSSASGDAKVEDVLASV